MQWGVTLGTKSCVLSYLCLSPSSSSVSTSTSRSSSLSILTPQKDPFRSWRISHKTSLLGAFSTSLLPWHGNTKTQKSQPGLPDCHTRDFDVWQMAWKNDLLMLSNGIRLQYLLLEWSFKLNTLPMLILQQGSSITSTKFGDDKQMTKVTLVSFFSGFENKREIISRLAASVSGPPDPWQLWVPLIFQKLSDFWQKYQWNGKITMQIVGNHHDPSLGCRSWC